jgi:tetratricopeptide (TPR) repeat protein
LPELVSKSLVVLDEGTGTSRYRLLETVREYAAEKLEQSGEKAFLEERFVAWCVAFVTRFRIESTPASRPEWLKRIDPEYANLHAAVGRGDGALLRICAGLWHFWERRGLLREGRYWCEQALKIPVDQNPEEVELRVEVLKGVGWIAQNMGDYVPAKQWLGEARDIYIRNNDRKGLGGVLNLLGGVTYYQNELDEARQLFRESIQIRKETGERPGLASALNNLGNISYRIGDHDEAERCYRESAELMREVGDERNLSLVLGNIASIISSRGDFDAAEVIMHESMEIRRRLEDLRGMGHCLYNLAVLNRCRGDLAAAQSLIQDAIALRRKTEDLYGLSRALVVLAGIHISQGDHQPARDLLQESLRLQRQIEDHVDVVDTLEEWGTLLAHQDDPLGAARIWDARQRCVRRTTRHASRDKGRISLRFRQRRKSQSRKAIGTEPGSTANLFRSPTRPARSWGNKKPRRPR